MPRYQLTISADSLPELTGAVTEAAALLQEGDSTRAMVAEVAQLAGPQPPVPTTFAGLPTPPPDYVAAGLTDYQQMQVRQAQSQPAAPPAPVAQATLPALADQVPACPIHAVQMVWKGGAISKSGKQLPLWSCPERNCREAIWAPR